MKINRRSAKGPSSAKGHTYAKGHNVRRPNSSGKTRKFKGGNPHRSDCVFHSNRISTEPNQDPNYYEIGVIHLSDATGINLVRGVVTGISNIFGAKGIDNTVYDALRKQTLTSLQKMMKPDEKICNLRMDFDSPSPELLYHHLYGTLLRKRPAKRVPPPRVF